MTGWEKNTVLCCAVGESGIQHPCQAGPGWRGSSHSATSDRLIHLRPSCPLPFYGIHDHTLDSKHRLTVPARARALLANGVTLTISFDKCLEVWPAEAHAQVVRRALAGMNPLTDEARALRRHFFGHTHSQDLDSAGRVMLPPNFLSHAGIDREVKVVGSDEYLELWDPAAWESQNSDLLTRAADHIASVGHPA